MVNKLGSKLVSELIEDEGLISKVVQNEIGGLAEGVGGTSIVNDINHRSKKSIFSFWKSGEKPDLSL